jgi:hypothetical protein
MLSLVPGTGGMVFIGSRVPGAPSFFRFRLDFGSSSGFGISKGSPKSLGRGFTLERLAGIFSIANIYLHWIMLIVVFLAHCPGILDHTT